MGAVFCLRCVCLGLFSGAALGKPEQLRPGGSPRGEGTHLPSEPEQQR